MGLLFPLTLLTGCGTSNRDEFHLPDPPPALQQCRSVPVPPIPGARGTALSAEQSVSAIAEQRGSAIAKTRCANDWAVWYFDLQAGLMK